MTPGSAAQRWADQLAAWAIPDEILRAAPESPWGHPPALFHAPAAEETPDTPSRAAALHALPEGGSVIDVGCGGGAASLALVPRAASIVGVDSSDAMLGVFAAACDERGVQHHEVLGTWPDVAQSHPLEPADVVVCHHVAYNVANLDDVVRALVGVAHYRVVMELTAAHPMTATAPLWRHFWNLDRPDGPTADDAVAVVRELGIEPHVERWSRPARESGARREDVVRFMRKRLCLTEDRDGEIAAILGDQPAMPRDVVTLWW